MLPDPEDDAKDAKDDDDIDAAEDGNADALKDGNSSAPEDGNGSTADVEALEDREDQKGNDYCGFCGVWCCG